MALIKKLLGKEPLLAPDCFLAETATLIGDVSVGAKSSIWYNVVLRGDVHSITIGESTNIQDNVVIHGTYQKFKTVLGNFISVGHSAVIHGCTIEDYVLVGMGAIIMDGAYIKSYSIIAGGAVVLPGTVVESGSVYAGVPAKKVKDLTEEQREGVKKNALNYLMYTKWYQE